MTTIWDFAKTMEKEAAEHYRSLAEKAPSREVSGVFNDMAREEDKHFRVFDSLSKAQKAPPVDASTILGEAKSAFAKIAATSSRPVFDSDAATAYQKALDMEKNSVKYYQDALAKTADAPSTLSLRAIISEETNHVRIVESLIEFVRRPVEWLENAEFTKLEEY